MQINKIVVLGFYNKNNLGDELFKEAFKQIFPKYDFTFTDEITSSILEGVSSVFIGGGSLLDGAPKIKPDALEKLKEKNIFYIGVGSETNIHPIHQELMKIAKLIAIRNNHRLDIIKELNNNTIVIPDLVYALQSKSIKNKSVNKSILILPNALVVPSWEDPQWKHAAWNYFKSEFAQFLDSLIESNYKINFFSMCQNNKSNDNWAAIEIINHMKNKSDNLLLTVNCNNIYEITNLFSQYENIITQRFHGIVLAQMTQKPYLAIHHHDKLKHCQPSDGNFISYYGLSKSLLTEQLNCINQENYSKYLPIDSNMFVELKQTIINLIGG